jgi:hypothetical protein
MNSQQKRNIKIAIAVIVVYLSSYIILSLYGDYKIDMSGKRRYSFGPAMMDVYLWQPHFTYCKLFKGVDGYWMLHANFLGYVFAPAALCDQAFAHKTIDMFDPNVGKQIDKMKRPTQ